MLFAIDFYKNFIDTESIAITLVSSLQAAGVNCTEFYRPESDGLSTDRDSSLGQEIFNITVAEVESIIEPDGVGNDIGRKAVRFICAHVPILPISPH
jgi:hypothetical protein